MACISNNYPKNTKFDRKDLQIYLENKIFKLELYLQVIYLDNLDLNT